MIMRGKFKVIWLVIISAIVVASAICWLSQEKEFTKEEIESYYPRP